VDAAALREKITHRLLDEIEEAMYPSVTMLDRVEAVLATPDDVADYAETLVEKVEATRFPSTAMLNRLDRLVARLDELEQRRRGRGQ
jgi:translation elongation factor EF-G